MAWGAVRGVDDLASRLTTNDPALTSLTLLSGRRLGHPEVEQLAAALRQNTVLTELSSCHSMPPASAAVLAAAIATHPALRRLSLGDSQFGDAGVSALLPAFHRLHVADLEHKSVTNIGCEALATVLGGCNCLAEINVSRNCVGDAGAASLCASLPASLEVLDLSSCGLTEVAGTHLRDALVTARAPLVSLHLRGNALGASGCTALAAGLQHARTLRTLDLSDSQAGDAGAMAIADALPASSLHRLNLGRCGISHIGAANLANATIRGVHALCLAGNPIGDVGAAALAAANVEQLDVSECGLTAAGASALIGPACVFTSLILLGNALGDDGVIVLAAALRADGAAPRLKHLSVSGTGMGFEGADALVGALIHGAGPQLNALEMGCNPAADGSDHCVAMVAKLRDGRADIDISWKASDQGDGAQGAR